MASASLAWPDRSWSTFLPCILEQSPGVVNLAWGLPVRAVTRRNDRADLLNQSVPIPLCPLAALSPFVSL